MVMGAVRARGMRATGSATFPHSAIMPLHPTWQDIAVRLVLTMACGMVIGYNREARGHAAGLRTTMLVGLAAAVAMIQANLLLPIAGKTPESFGVMDLMRLPLGVLTGVGFIGGGAILKRGSAVTGVTTAATLWVMTAIGLCLGGGQIGLGLAATVLGVLTLWTLKAVDARVPREQRATLLVAADADWSALTGLDALIKPLGYRASFRGQTAGAGPDKPASLEFEIRWMQGRKASDRDAEPPAELLQAVHSRYAVLRFRLAPESH
jgi:putative Mg2+ transporter-C (MgtC) family protein